MPSCLAVVLNKEEFPTCGFDPSPLMRPPTLMAPATNYRPPTAPPPTKTAHQPTTMQPPITDNHHHLHPSTQPTTHNPAMPQPNNPCPPFFTHPRPPNDTQPPCFPYPPIHPPTQTHPLLGATGMPAIFEMNRRGPTGLSMCATRVAHMPSCYSVSVALN